MDRLVFFHKTPALWNKNRNLPPDPRIITLDKMKKQLSNHSVNIEMAEFFSTDVYFQMCKEICATLEIKELHIVHGFKEGEPRNWSVREDEGWCEIDEITTYWSLKEADKLLGFMDSSIILTRGNYPLLHQWLTDNSIPNPGRFWLHYPATSIRFPHLNKFEKKIRNMIQTKENVSKLELNLIGMGLEHNLKLDSLSLESGYNELFQHFRTQRKSILGGPYTMVLADDKYNLELLSNVFPKSLVQKFAKPAIWHESNCNANREYDLIYCGTSLQSTKNHHCFVQLLKLLDTFTDVELNIAIAGNKSDSQIFDNLFTYPYSNIKIFNKGEVSRKELRSLFSKSKAMILTSGRDANPRIIQESLVHGARVISVDTLSDGLDFLSSNPLLGAVLSSDISKWKYSRNGNLEFTPTVKLASLVSNEIEKSHFPDLVMKISRRKLSVENSVHPIVSSIKSFR